MEIDHNSFPRRGPNYHIASVMAGIVEALLPKLGYQAISSALARKIGGPIAGEDQIEKFQVIRHLAGDLLVISRCQNKRAPQNCWTACCFILCVLTSVVTHFGEKAPGD